MEMDTIAVMLEWIRSRRFGKYRGIVVENQDDEGRGRLLVRIPAVGNIETWALPCVPYAGPGVGLVALPPPESLVWVEFEAGDPQYAIWTGCFWAKDEAPEQAKPDVKIWKTDKHTLRLDDGKGEIRVANSKLAELTLGAELSAATGGEAKLTVSPTGGVVSEQGAAHKIEVTVASVRVNNGALEIP